MASKRKDITPPSDFRRYLDGLMSARERHDFEKAMLNDDFESEALEGLAELGKAQYSKDMDSLRHQLKDRTAKPMAGKYWRMAAALVLLAIFSFTVYYLIDNNTSPNISQTKQSQEEITPENQKDETAMEDSSNQEDGQNLAMQQKPLASDDGKASPEESLKTPALKSKSPELVVPDDVVIEEEIYLDMDMEIANEELDLQSMGLEEEEEPEVALSIPEEAKAKIDQAPAMAMKKEVDHNRSLSSTRSGRYKTITGKVVSAEDEEALPGVNVIVKGTSVGTTTNVDGDFRLVVPVDSSTTLQFSSIGFVQEEIMAQNQNEVNAELQPDLAMLSEIVVIGYGTQSKSDVTGAISTVEIEEGAPYNNFIPPKPVGGNTKFKDYIKNNLRYPESGIANQVKGTVKVKFTVGPNGTISDLHVVKSLGDDFDQEALRLIKEGPAWEAATDNDTKVAREVSVNFRFRPK